MRLAGLDAELERMGLPTLTDEQAEKFALHLDLLLRWNAKTNLTAIRDAAGIERRHFAESVWAAGLVPADAATLLDFGSGAGFPGVPIAILRPDIEVTLAESQGKKSSFLREVVRTLGLGATDVWAGRVEQMPGDRLFDVVALRAVDRMEVALREGLLRVAAEGQVLCLGDAPPASGWTWQMRQIPCRESIAMIGVRDATVPRGTVEPG